MCKCCCQNNKEVKKECYACEGGGEDEVLICRECIADAILEGVNTAMRNLKERY